jgi:Uncharacterised nucleotidyltransferase
VNSAAILVNILRDPSSIARGSSPTTADDWTALIALARAELLLGTLAHRLRGIDLPAPVQAVMEDARINAEYQRRSALWEADCARRALAQFDGGIVLMKGTAYAAAGLRASTGRHIGDLDIMVAKDKIASAEALLLSVGGWEWVKEDAYDDAYYRDHMHELPPLIHKERDRMIDVHHTILPPTARPNPDAMAMLDASLPLEDGLRIFAPADMVCHCAAHLIADGDLTGGLRNLWDMHCLLEEFAGRDVDFWSQLDRRAGQHQLTASVRRSARISARLYGTAIPAGWHGRVYSDALFIRRLCARDGWGRGTAKFTRLLFYIRSHWMRMPPALLARHLWTKWRKGKQRP